MKRIRSAVARLAVRSARPRREPLWYFGSFGDDFFGDDHDDDR